MKTAIVTDSNSGITQEQAARWGVRVVPMPIIIDNEIYYEGVNLSPEQFYQYLREGRNVSTSQPAPEDLTGVWNSLLAEGWDEIVYIPMSSGLSSSCQTALILAGDYGGRVQVADNHQISVPQKNAVRDAAALAQAGLEAREIKARLEEAGGDSLIYIGVDTLEYLKRGGRITPAVAAMGSVLNIKPLLAIRGRSWTPLPRSGGSGGAGRCCWNPCAGAWTSTGSGVWTSAWTPPAASRARRRPRRGRTWPPRPFPGRRSSTIPCP